ncbi:MarR family winged helix-turn-helix transcriptional regulator [Aestuariivirga litoralis]|uniref:MarR family winged helix-turn-helix transcriptional regulator n=1 Tax=Aestuariivirga litoralis TaxID=2650924 RepID=UPI0018C479D2|nr:MarR family winged helix-turn-helix transcriptional regulator [Aestuariivirga litoralis]MBG1233068.1 winged helix-turn-helix transcriptional regulator [Aestuariivirga litoralis]
MLDLAYIPENCFGFRARSTARAITRVLDARMQKVGLRISQFSVLVALNQSKDASVATLSRSLDIEASALTRNLAVLKKNKWVESDNARGRGGQSVKLTPAGAAVLKRAVKIWHQTQAEFEAALGADADRARNILRKIERVAQSKLKETL